MAANNLEVGIVLSGQTKLKADLEVLKAELRKANAEVKKQSDAFVASGARDNAQVLKAAAVQQTLQREVIQTNQALMRQTRAFAEHGLAAAGAARGMHALSAAHAEAGEASSVNVREITKISKELGNLEVSGFGVAKMFKEFPKVAVPLAIAAGTLAAAKKLASATYTNVTALDDLSKASGFAKVNIIALEHAFEGADVGGDTLKQMLLSVGQSFDKAKVKSTDLGGAMFGVNVGRGPGIGVDDSHGPGYRADGYGPGSFATQSITPGVGGYQAPLPHVVSGREAPGTPGREVGGTGFDAGTGMLVTRGGQPLSIDPSKGFAGLADPSRFKTQEQFLAAATETLLKINERFPSMAREIVRGQGLDPVATLRGLTGTTAPRSGEFQAEALNDPRLRQGILPTARTAGAGFEQFGAARERQETEAGIGPLQGAARDLPAINSALDATTEKIRSIRETTEQWIDSMKGASLGADSQTWATQWEAQIGNVTTSYDGMVSHMNSTAPTLPAVGGGSQEGQVIPIPGGMASGGIVSGRGSGDTVPAWLTPGEYVARRASVGYYGAGLFAALNNRAIPRGLFSRIGYASGGLVGDMAGFAEGGSVRGGTPVHLHLDGQSFATSATESVAGALVVAARRQQMRSAGVKPSWYGGRPGA